MHGYKKTKANTTNVLHHDSKTSDCQLKIAGNGKNGIHNLTIWQWRYLEHPEKSDLVWGAVRGNRNKTFQTALNLANLTSIVGYTTKLY